MKSNHGGMQLVIDELDAKTAALKPIAEASKTNYERELLQRAEQPEPRPERQEVRGVFEKHPGSGMWWIRYVSSDGVYRREKAGTLSQAKNLLTLRRADALRGKKLKGLRQRTVSFAELADDAIEYVKGKYSRPADDVARLELLKEHFAGAADAITPSKIKRVLNALAAEKHWSASSTNHHHNLISVAFRVGIENEKVEQNPARAVRRQKEDTGHVRFLTPDEEKKLRDSIRSKPEWAEHEVELDLALSTGLRRSAMYVGLTWENVDLVAKTLTIPRADMKNDEGITLPLNPDALRALAIFRLRGNGTGRVVRNAAGETLLVNAHWFVDAVRAAGIPPFRWHDCRHTFASRLRQKGVDLATIAELLGHSPKSGFAMTKRYAHLAISNLHAAVSLICNSTTVAPDAKSAESEFAYRM
jgi:integrase